MIAGLRCARQVPWPRPGDAGGEVRAFSSADSGLCSCAGGDIAGPASIVNGRLAVRWWPISDHWFDYWQAFGQIAQQVATRQFGGEFCR